MSASNRKDGGGQPPQNGSALTVLDDGTLSFTLDPATLPDGNSGSTAQFMRGDRPRARSIPPRPLTQEEIQMGALLDPVTDYERPRTRRDCLTAEETARIMGYDDGKGDGINCSRPCPFVSCRHHLYLDVNPATGTIKLNFPHLEVWEMQETCALDVADHCGVTLDDVGEILNLTRERIRQVEVRALLALKQAGVDLLKGRDINS